jgi:hypothetical protein
MEVRKFDAVGAREITIEQLQADGNRLHFADDPICKGPRGEK